MAVFKSGINLPPLLRPKSCTIGGIPSPMKAYQAFILSPNDPQRGARGEYFFLIIALSQGDPRGGGLDWTFLSPKGMDKSAQGCAEHTTLGRGPVPLAPSLKGMNTPRRLLSIPVREWEGGSMGLPAAGPLPWADLCIPFGEKDASLHKSRLGNETLNSPATPRGVAFGLVRMASKCANSRPSREGRVRGPCTGLARLTSSPAS
jgi:hypothetical protein